LIYFIAFFDRPVFLLIPATVAAIFWGLVGSYMFDGINLATIFNVRFLSYLAVIPRIHIMILVLSWSRLSLLNLLLATLQLSLFFFSYSIRGSVIWMVLAIFSLPFFFLIVAAIRAKNLRLVTFSATFLKLSLWPVGLLQIAFAALSTYKSSNMHPAYLMDDFVPNHLRFHNAYLGLSHHPRFVELFGEEHRSVRTGEMHISGGFLGYSRAEKYWVEKIGYH